MENLIVGNMVLIPIDNFVFVGNIMTPPPRTQNFNANKQSSLLQKT